MSLMHKNINYNSVHKLNNSIESNCNHKLLIFMMQTVYKRLHGGSVFFKRFVVTWFSLNVWYAGITLYNKSKGLDKGLKNGIYLSKKIFLII